LVYTTFPQLDATGLIYTVGQYPTFPGGVNSVSYDISVSINQTIANGNVALQEHAVGSNPSLNIVAYGGSSRWGFTYNAYVAGQPPQCAATTGTTVAYQQWSFAYFINGTANGSPYTITASGILTTFNASIKADGLLSYSISNMSGFRQYVDNLGNNSVVTITGVAGNLYGAVGWLYNQALFPSAPYFDTYGVLYTFTGTAMTPVGPIVAGDNTQVLNIFYQPPYQASNGQIFTTGSYQEEGYVNSVYTSAADTIGFFFD